MKSIYSIFLMLLLPVLLAGCGKDNYDAPESTMSGVITYNGEALNLRGTDQKIRLQLYQDGYAKHDPIEVFVGQDGKFSAKLFDGEYKLVTRDNNGPWVNSRDTTVVELRGTTTRIIGRVPQNGSFTPVDGQEWKPVFNFEVTPYFTVSNASISLSGNAMNASLAVKRTVAGKEVETVMLLLGSTAFVDDGFNVLRKDYGKDKPETAAINNQSGTTNSVTLNLSAELNSNSTNAKALYGRVGVKISGVEQAIYSQVFKLK